MVITYRHFKPQQVDKEFNIFICFSVKPSVTATEQSAGKENKRMFMKVLHEMLTGKTRSKAVSCYKWARDLKQHGHHLQYLQLLFLF